MDIVEITKLDAGLENRGFKMGELITVAGWIKDKYPVVLDINGIETVLYPNEFKKVKA